jgi:hypothetical protein
MSTDKLKLLLDALEAEVCQEALELYVQAQPSPIDRRFEYRYRAARSVLESLRQGNREFGTFPHGPDEGTTLSDDGGLDRRPLRERIED